jgi:DNA end-binding protein Ku
MARAIWSGAISFGLVNVPVKAYAAVRDHKIHFHQLDKATGSRIHYEKVAEKTGEEVSGDQIELGYELEKGKLVVVDPDELAALQPRTTRTIDISDFVDITEIDPVYYQRSYWLAPDGEGAGRAYRLLVAAMEDRGKVGIGMVVMRNKQYLAAVRPREGALSLSTMRFADEVLDPDEAEDIPDARTKIPPKELKLATQIIDSLATAWKPEAYRDTYTSEVQKLIKRREKGEDIVVEEEAAQPDNVTDLMEVLQASLAASKKGQGRSRAKTPRKAAASADPSRKGSKARTKPASASDRARSGRRRSA